MIISLNTALDLKILSPSEPIGIFIIFVGAVIFPFNMIHAKARKIDSQNPQEAANGYKNSDNATFFGYEEIN